MENKNELLNTYPFSEERGSEMPISQVIEGDLGRIAEDLNRLRLAIIDTSARLNGAYPVPSDEALEKEQQPNGIFDTTAKQVDKVQRLVSQCFEEMERLAKF